MNISGRLQKCLAPQTISRLREIGRITAQRCQESVLVGGPVRDALLGRHSKDIDVVITHPVLPIIQKLISKSGGEIIRRSQFMTYQLSFPDGSHTDIVTARKESYPQSAVLPVVQPSDLLHDLARRDFTVNAMAMFLSPHCFGKLIDPLGGKPDLNNRCLRVLHSRSFQDDPTRIFRAARYAARMNLTLEKETKIWIRDALQKNIPARLTPARLSHEWQRTLLENDPRGALQLLGKWGALKFLFHRWRWKPEHEKLRPEKPMDDLLALRLLFWCQPFGPKPAEKAMTKLQIPGAARKKVILGLSLLKSTHRRDPRVAAQVDKTPESVRVFLSRALPRPLWKQVLAARPGLSGKDLVEMGYPMGPQLGKIITDIAKERWEGRLHSRRDETRFVIDNFPIG